MNQPSLHTIVTLASGLGVDGTYAVAEEAWTHLIVVGMSSGAYRAGRSWERG